MLNKSRIWLRIRIQCGKTQMFPLKKSEGNLVSFLAERPGLIILVIIPLFLWHAAIRRDLFPGKSRSKELASWRISPKTIVLYFPCIEGYLSFEQFLFLPIMLKSNNFLKILCDYFLRVGSADRKKVMPLIKRNTKKKRSSFYCPTFRVLSRYF